MRRISSGSRRSGRSSRCICRGIEPFARGGLVDLDSVQVDLIRVAIRVAKAESFTAAQLDRPEESICESKFSTLQRSLPTPAHHGIEGETGELRDDEKSASCSSDPPDERTSESRPTSQAATAKSPPPRPSNPPRYPRRTKRLRLEESGVSTTQGRASCDSLREADWPFKKTAIDLLSQRLASMNR